MKLTWIHESPPRWDDEKARIIGGAPPGVFDLPARKTGDLLPGEWWRVEDQGATAGYGWLDCTWGDAEILLAVDPARESRGVGTFILDRLEAEAVERGLNYLFNMVRPTHPDAEGLKVWLQARRFTPAGDDGRLLRRAVRK